MTAEIAILNKSAVALAADSAATIGEQKTYNTVNKLFGLSTAGPVGIMIYSAADVSGIPWETLVKEFRSGPGRAVHADVEGYVGSFFGFLRDVELPEGAIATEVAATTHALVQRLTKVTQQAMMRVLAKDIDAPGREIREAARDACIAYMSGMHNDLSKRAYFQGFGDAEAARLAKAHFDPFLEAIGDQLRTPGGPEVPLDPTLVANLRETLGWLLTKPTNVAPYSGLVVAGFGAKEIFPTLVHVPVWGLGASGVRAEAPEIQRISNQQRALVRAFAQDRMARIFMDGIGESVLDRVRTLLERTLQHDLPGAVAKAAQERGLASDGQKLKALLTAVGQGVSQELLREIGRYCYETETAPVMAATAFLPKEDLAVLAESLVHLTSLRKRVSLEPETVGGAIDVAVISKGDGFVWMKRKHYFPADLNPHFASKYAFQAQSGETIHGEHEGRSAAARNQRDAHPQRPKGRRRPSRRSGE